SAQIREILISESAWEEMTCLFAPSLSRNGSSAPPCKCTLRSFRRILGTSPSTLPYFANRWP
ncbi:hypothetical protein ELJ43_10820, partial [Klebsiella pneumoniae]|nr:hypothetical protein [Klebsiella pneumoniae]